MAVARVRLRRNRELVREQLGATLAEYSLMLALVTIVALGAWAALGDATVQQTACVAGVIGGSGGPCVVSPRHGSITESLRDGPTGPRGEPGAGRIDRAVPSALALLSGALGADGRITTAQLAALTTTDPRLAPLRGPSLSHALDLASGGDADGVISREDIAMIADAALRGELAERLADTAAGRGGRDHHASRDDYEALANDRALPASLREWALTRAEELPEHHGGCGLNPVCHVEHARDAAVHAVGGFAWNHGGRGVWEHTAGWALDKTESVRHSAGGAIAWSRGLMQSAQWMTGVAPPLDPRQWDDWVKFRIDAATGFGEAAYDTALGLGAGARWAFTPGRKDIDLGTVWTAVRSMPRALWNELDGCAAASGRACGRLAFDAGATIVPGGAGARGARVASAMARARRIARSARDARPIPEAVRPEARVATAGAAQDGLHAEQAALNAQKIRANEFFRSRTLRDYQQVLGDGLRARLDRLRNGDHWVDMGAGDAGAIEDFLSEPRFTRGRGGGPFRLRQQPPRTTALGYDPPASLERLSQLEGFRALHGRLLEDYALDEIGRADLITDLYGPAAYSEHLDEVVSIYGRLAKPDADIMFLVDHKTTIVNAAGETMENGQWLREWIASSRGVELESLTPSEYGVSQIVHLRRTAGELHIPQLPLRDLRASDGVGNPYRTYVWDP